MTARTVPMMFVFVTLLLAASAHAAGKPTAPASNAGADEAARIQAMSEAEVLPLILDLVLGEGGTIEKMKQRPTHAHPYAIGKLHFATKQGYQAFEQRMVSIVVANTGEQPQPALQLRACMLRARAEKPAFDNDDARDLCKNKRDIGWWLKSAENPYMRSAMVLGLLAGKNIADELRATTMDRLLQSLGDDVELYLVDTPDHADGVQHFRRRELAPAQWGQTTFRLAWLVSDERPNAPKTTIAALKAAQKKAPAVRCKTFAVVLVQDFDGRKYTPPYMDASFYAGGDDTDVKVVPCKDARKQKDKLLDTIKADWDAEDGKLIGAGPVKGADWIVGREFGKPVRKTKAVRVFVEEPS